MDFGVHLPASGPAAQAEHILRFAKRADELGFFCLTVADHIVIPANIRSRYPYTLDGKYAGAGHHLEQTAVMSFVAGATRRIRLVASVLVAPYRNPVVVAKIFSTLDFLSRGRVIVGVGAGWMKEEFQALGAPPFEERGRVTDEYIRVFRELWRQETPRFSGAYCSFSDIVFLPKPVQKPSIPIWIGGHSERALRRAAELGDGWHPIGGVPSVSLEPEELERKIEKLARYARAAGRDPKRIRVAFKASLYDRGAAARPGRRRRFTGSADEIAADAREYKKAGADCVILDVRSPDPAEALERLQWLAEEVVPRVG
ncbi:MAG TPA: LLM class F420-dependent oxidoreductase [Candidatus Acidoferrales bacterium]|nr:LLM class F420-dependent oxidoreductase [Candidatus Acidoferrales bacterium]